MAESLQIKCIEYNSYLSYLGLRSYTLNGQTPLGAFSTGFKSLHKAGKLNPLDLYWSAGVNQIDDGWGPALTGPALPIHNPGLLSQCGVTLLC